MCDLTYLNVTYSCGHGCREYRYNSFCDQAKASGDPCPDDECISNSEDETRPSPCHRCV